MKPGVHDASCATLPITVREAHPVSDQASTSSQVPRADEPRHAVGPDDMSYVQSRFDRDERLTMR